MKTRTYALAGNPNCGKTTLFNALTGSTAHVGNWPGVTVDRREGVYKGGKEPVSIVDLPGIYSLSPYTPEEVIARNYILSRASDVIINVVDATNLERNLYLTTQLSEIDVPIVVALNMIDEAEKIGDVINEDLLEKELGVPVVKISALKEKGLKELISRAEKALERKGRCVAEKAVSEPLERALRFYEEKGENSPLFHAVKLLENDELETAKSGAADLRRKIAEGKDLEAVIADERYRYISEKLAVARKENPKKEKLSRSDKIDGVLTHRVFAIPIFLLVMFAVFHITFSEDFLFIGGLSRLFGEGLPSLESLSLSESVAMVVGIFYDGAIFSPGVILYNLLDLPFSLITEAVGGAISSEWLSGLVADGILGGLFAVLGFLPQILLLFAWFSLLEDSGYMARIAFVLDRIFRRFGLSGRSFMPMIMGFGCSVPAMINTRTLSDEKERIATVRVIPFFSCGAKLPILTAIAGAIVSRFGMGNADLITCGMYILGMVTAVVCVVLMRSTVLKGEAPPFIMELPAYRLPGFKSLMLHLWDKAKHFVGKAFTVIFVSTVIIWALSHFTPSWEYLSDEEMNLSVLASIGMFIQPLFTPLGFGSQLGAFGWVFAVAAVTGLVAKENVIATFGLLAACIVGFATEDGDGVASAVTMIEATGITAPALIAFIAFNMTTVPCFAACATARAELPKGKFASTVLFWIAASYVVSTATYTIGSAPWSALVWIAAAVLTAVVIALVGSGKLRGPKNLFRVK